MRLFLQGILPPSPNPLRATTVIHSIFDDIGYITQLYQTSDHLHIVGVENGIQMPSVRLFETHDNLYQLRRTDANSTESIARRHPRLHNYPLLHTTIPLPPLADVPILIDSLLAYSPSGSLISYNVTRPPSTAALSSSAAAQRIDGNWQRLPAMSPSTVGSLTIRVPLLQRPIVIFPATLVTNIVTIEDVLSGVYHALLSEFLEELSDSAPRDFQSYSVNNKIEIRQYFRQRNMWMGLFASQQERDVWILQTRSTHS